MRNKIKIYVILLITILMSISFNNYVVAHKVTTAGDVGATLHLEPNDTPRSGEPTKTWFALTRKGGQVIPLEDCNCQLSIYAEPYSPGEPPLLEPPLKPITAERYQGIPGTEINFPRPGAYQLQLSGKPKQQGRFQPFQLKFSVTVAAGKVAAEAPQNTQEVKDDVTLNQSPGIPLWAIALSGLAVVGVFLGILRTVKRD